MSHVDLNDFVFVDETRVNIAMTRPYGRAPKGERVHTSAPVNKSKNVTVLGALSYDGMLAAMTLEGSTDTQGFFTFVQTILVPTWRPGQIVMMDHLSSHKVNGVQEALEAVGATLEYLPSYSPDFSPIEACWSKCKEFLRAKTARTRERLDHAITEALARITPQDARGWFSHCGYL
jgi:transposase